MAYSVPNMDYIGNVVDKWIITSYYLIGYQIPADGYVVYESSSGSWLNLNGYFLSNADYTEFNRYHDSGGWHNRSGYVYGRYKVSAPSYYWFALN